MKEKQLSHNVAGVEKMIAQRCGFVMLGEEYVSGQLGIEKTDARAALDELVRRNVLRRNGTSYVTLTPTYPSTPHPHFQALAAHAAG